MQNAARMQAMGLDGMRYLGADPARPADAVEQAVMVKLHNRTIRELKEMADA